MTERATRLNFAEVFAIGRAYHEETLPATNREGGGGQHERRRAAAEEGRTSEHDRLVTVLSQSAGPDIEPGLAGSVLDVHRARGHVKDNDEDSRQRKR